jgi:hypothetical protein
VVAWTLYVRATSKRYFFAMTGGATAGHADRTGEAEEAAVSHDGIWWSLDRLFATDQSHMRRVRFTSVRYEADLSARSAG